MFKNRETPEKMQYNSHQEKLLIPEYGRIIANYIKKAMAIEDMTGSVRAFGPKYFYGYGRTYFLNLYINF